MNRTFILFALLLASLCSQAEKVDTLYRISAREFQKSLVRWGQTYNLEQLSMKKGMAMQEYIKRHWNDKEGLNFMRTGDSYYDSKTMFRHCEKCAEWIQKDSIVKKHKARWEEQLPTAEGEKYTDIPVLRFGKRYMLSELIDGKRHVVLSFLRSSGNEKEREMLKKKKMKHSGDSLVFLEAAPEAANTYAVHRFPETIIISRNGMISVRNLSGERSIENALFHHTQQESIWDDYDWTPRFPGGGEPALREFLKKNLKNPEKWKGRLILSLVVEEDGSLTHVKVSNDGGASEKTQQEALRMVKNMPKWIPANVLGETKAVSLHLPLLFE